MGKRTPWANILILFGVLRSSSNAVEKGVSNVACRQTDEC